MTRPGPKLKQYSKEMLKRIDGLIDRDTLGLKAIAKRLHTHCSVLYRNMEAYYGSERWEAIVAERREWRGFQKCAEHPPGLNTRFKKNQLRGAAARRWRPIGTILVKKDKTKARSDHVRGRMRIKRRRFIKVADKPYGGGENWQLYARYLWEQNHGPIPVGMCVVHLDADLMNDSDENLSLMTRIDYCRYLESRFPLRKQQRARRVGRANRERCRVPRKATVWECTGCAAEFQNKPEHCLKCNSYSFEQIKKRKIA